MFGFGKKIKTLNDKEVHLKQTVLDKAKLNGIKLFPKTLEFFNSNAVKYHDLKLDHINTSLLGLDKPYKEFGFVEIYRSNKDHGKIWNKTYDHIGNISKFKTEVINNYMHFIKPTKNGKSYVWLSTLTSGTMFGRGGIIVHMKDLNDMVEEIDSCWERFGKGVDGGVSMFSYLTGNSDDYYSTKSYSWVGDAVRGVSKFISNARKNVIIDAMKSNGQYLYDDMVAALDRNLLVYHDVPLKLNEITGEYESDIPGYGLENGLFSMTLPSDNEHSKNWNKLLYSITLGKRRGILKIKGNKLEMREFKSIIGNTLAATTGNLALSSTLWFPASRIELVRKLILKTLDIKSITEL